MPTNLIGTFAGRVQLEKVRPDEAVTVAVTVKSGFIVKQGDVIGEITASGLYRRRTRATVNTGAFATNAATGQVLDASVFAVGDVLKNAAGDTVGTIQSIDLTTTPHTITLTGNAAEAVAVAADVIGSDGSQVAKGISGKETDGTQDTPIDVFIGGFLDESKLRGLDASAKTELNGASVAGGIFKL